MKRTGIKRSQAQEKKTAKLHGGRVQPGSGNGWANKSDVKTKVYLMECKRTDARQITLKADDLEKNWTEAWSEGRVPVLCFELAGKRYVVQEEGDWIEHSGAWPGAGTRQTDVVG